MWFRRWGKFNALLFGLQSHFDSHIHVTHNTVHTHTPFFSIRNNRLSTADVPYETDDGNEGGPVINDSGIELKRYSKNTSRLIHQQQQPGSDAAGKTGGGHGGGSRTKEFVERNKKVIESGNMFKKPSLRLLHKKTHTQARSGFFTVK